MFLNFQTLQKMLGINISYLYYVKWDPSRSESDIDNAVHRLNIRACSGLHVIHTVRENLDLYFKEERLKEMSFRLILFLVKLIRILNLQYMQSYQILTFIYNIFVSPQ